MAWPSVARPGVARQGSARPGGVWRGSVWRGLARVPMAQILLWSKNSKKFFPNVFIGETAIPKKFQTDFLIRYRQSNR